MHFIFEQRIGGSHVYFCKRYYLLCIYFLTINITNLFKKYLIKNDLSHFLEHFN